MRALLLSILLLLPLSTAGQSATPIAVERTKSGVITIVWFEDICGTYDLWLDVSFDLFHWYHFKIGTVEGYGSFYSAIPSRFWSVGNCAFWDYRLVKVNYNL